MYQTHRYNFGLCLGSAIFLACAVGFIPEQFTAASIGISVASASALPNWGTLVFASKFLGIALPLPLTWMAAWAYRDWRTELAAAKKVGLA